MRRKTTSLMIANGVATSRRLKKRSIELEKTFRLKSRLCSHGNDMPVSSFQKNGILLEKTGA